MNKKTLAAGILAAFLLAAPASAHCGAGHYTACRAVNQPVAMCCPACTVEDCAIAGRHIHDGVTYCGTYHENGICTVDCLLAASAGNTSGAAGTSGTPVYGGGYYGGHHGGGHHGKWHC